MQPLLKDRAPVKLIKKDVLKAIVYQLIKVETFANYSGLPSTKFNQVFQVVRHSSSHKFEPVIQILVFISNRTQVSGSNFDELLRQAKPWQVHQLDYSNNQYIRVFYLYKETPCICQMLTHYPDSRWDNCVLNK